MANAAGSLSMRLGCVILAISTGVVAFGVPASSWAQDESREQRELSEDELFEPRESETERSTRERGGEREVERVDEKPLELMTREEAAAAGFVFGDTQEESSRTSATFLAATAGLLAHGVGHWMLDEKRTATVLLAAEGASVALMSSALLWRWLGDDSTASRVYSGPALYLGVGLFGLSYLLDVVGTIQNPELGMPDNTRQHRGISIEAHYAYLQLEGYPSENLQLLTAGSTVDLGWGYLGARTDQDVYLDTAVYGLEVGWRPWRGAGRHNFVFVEADGELFQFSGAGTFSRLSAEARVGLSVDLGNWISRLRNIAVGASTGYGSHWYALPVQGQSALEYGLHTGYVPFELFTHFNLTDRLNARVAYEHREGDFLQSAPAGLAVTSLEFLYQSSDILDLVVRGELGGGLGVTGGLRLWFWE